MSIGIDTTVLTNDEYSKDCLQGHYCAAVTKFNHTDTTNVCRINECECNDGQTGYTCSNSTDHVFKCLDEKYCAATMKFNHTDANNACHDKIKAKLKYQQFPIETMLGKQVEIKPEEKLGVQNCQIYAKTESI